jgi:hypothetical protein
MAKKKIQLDRLLEFFKAGGKITTYEAYVSFKITQLGRCIDDLQKRGYEFEKEWIQTKDGAHVKRYSLNAVPHQPVQFEEGAAKCQS